MTLPPDLGAPYLSPHLGGRPSRRPTGHGGSDSHGLLAATHQQAGRLLGHPLQLGSPPLIGPHPGLFQPPHNCRLAPSDGFAPLHNVCWRAGVLRPRWRTTSYYWTKQARCAMVTLTLCFCLSSLVRPDRDRDTCHESDFLGRTRRSRAHTDVFELFLDKLRPKINKTICYHRLSQAEGTHVSPTRQFDDLIERVLLMLGTPSKSGFFRRYLHTNIK